MLNNLTVVFSHTTTRTRQPKQANPNVVVPDAELPDANTAKAVWNQF